MVQRTEALGCDWVFTSNGTVPIVPDTLAATVSKISQEMVKSRESRFSFISSDIRRTVETLLASKGISRDIRSQIQSHGLSGVQVRHYDRHDYRDEKRRVLEFLADLLHGSSDAKGVPLHSQVA
jgi:molybdopterin-guanine dinucleotide biosynthesis protein A